MSSTSTKLRFDGRVAIVTGGAQGMGKAHSMLLGSRGAKVVINDLDEKGAEATVKAIQAEGGEGIAVAGSISERSVIEAIVDAAINTWGRIDILINNAGIDFSKPFTDFTDSDFSRFLGVHVWGTWLLTQLSWPHMQRAKYGRVLIVCSHSIFGMPGNSAYTTAKGALFGLGRTLALEGESDGIHVNLLAPVAATAMAKEMLGGQESVFEWASQQYPPSTVSSVASWLVHEDCKANGEFIGSYGRGLGKIALTHSRGVVCDGQGEFTPEVVRDNFAKALEMDGAMVLTSINEVQSSIISPGEKVSL
ncbi:3-oxoacyl-acp reductase [Fusarium sporotrichioides]|uniref:3-oxoacyl-acp reductase n=1 Tax=Fusarium sporotrichioides TaxID=5514 RepID=A0A395RUV0_FUSSP|nr:3-oxoacyl-acp reductase [Fusarium sporotrichioides]